MESITIYLKNAFIRINDLVKFGNQIILGSVNPGNLNKSGDLVKKLDLFSHDIIVDEIKKSYNIIGYISEENPNIVFNNYKKNLESMDTLEYFSEEKYIIAFDPLDGSSNIDSNITTGSIFAIYEYNLEENSITDIICSGYCLYGPATILVITEQNIKGNDEVNMYQLNKENKFEFIEQIDFKKNPDKINKKIYSINECYFNQFDQETKNLVLNFKENNYNHRYIGSMVSDCHRTLIQGGIFLYPRNSKKPNGKIRLLYEAIPLAIIFTIANGFAYDDDLKVNILEKYIGGENKIYLQDFDIHSTTPIILSSKELI